MQDLLAITTSHGGTTHLTGVLLCANGSVLGVLEGPSATIGAIVDRVKSNPASGIENVASRQNLIEREFKDWYAGFVQLREKASETRERLARLQDEFASDATFSGMDVLARFVAP